MAKKSLNIWATFVCTNLYSPRNFKIAQRSQTDRVEKLVRLMFTCLLIPTVINYLFLSNCYVPIILYLYLIVYLFLSLSLICLVSSSLFLNLTAQFQCVKVVRNEDERGEKFSRVKETKDNLW